MKLFTVVSAGKMPVFSLSVRICVLGSCFADDLVHPAPAA